MSLTLLLERPDTGIVAPAVVSGSIEYQLDRYPRWYMTASLRPDPEAVHLWQSPYGTRAHVMRPDGSMLFSGPVYTSTITRPDGQWTVQAADDTLLLRNWRSSNTPGQFLPGGVMDVPTFIRALAAHAGVALEVTGSGGTVNAMALDISASEGWSLVEEQLIANNLDVWPQGDGTLFVAPTAAMKAGHDWAVTVGDAGTITAYGVTMNRVYNRVLLTHEAGKDGEDEARFIEGVWEDTTSVAGLVIGPNVYTRTVRVGADWWDDPAGHQAQADANAAAVAQAIRGIARAASLEVVPDYRIAVGSTVLVTFLVGTTDRFLVTGIAWPFEPGAMRLDLRNPEPGWPGSTFFAEEAADARYNV